VVGILDNLFIAGAEHATARALGRITP